MPKHDIRSTHMPYCLIRQASGGYVLVNRDYKPLGFTASRFETYANYPIEVSFKKLTPAVAAQLSYKGAPDLERIYLYGDSCTPSGDLDHIRAYLDRLAILMALQIKVAGQDD